MFVVKNCIFSLVITLMLVLTNIVPVTLISASSMDNITHYIVLSLFDEQGNPLEYTRNDLSQYKIAAVETPSNSGKAYLPVAAFASEGVEASEVSAGFLPAEFIVDSGNEATISKIAEEMNNIPIASPASNQIVFAYDRTLVDTNIIVDLSGKKLSYWTYTTYPDKQEVLSDGSLIVPASNMGMGLSLNLYYAKSDSKTIETEVDNQKIEIIDNNSESNSATVASTDNKKELTASFENLRTLINTLNNYLPGLPSRNGYRASVVVKQMQKMLSELKSKASTSGEQQLLTRAEELITKAKQKLKVTTVVSLPATGESMSSIYIIVVLVVLVLALLIVRKFINRGR